MKINEEGMYIDPKNPNIFIGPAFIDKNEILPEPWPPKSIINNDIRIKTNEILLFDKLPEPTNYSK